MIYGRCLTAPLLFLSALGSIPTVFTAASAEEMVGNVLGLLIIVYLAYFIWATLGRIYLTIPYRKEIVEKATGLRLELGPLQARGYYIEKTLSQIEQHENDVKEAARVKRETKKAVKAKRDRELEKLISQNVGVSNDSVTALRLGNICVGMPKPFVDFMFGKSYEEKKEASKKYQRLTCKYVKGEKNRLGNITYKWEVKFLDGIVDSFKEL